MARTEEGVSRRGFLKGAAIASSAAALAGLAGCAPSANKESEATAEVQLSDTSQQDWDAEYDAIVVGAGAGGFMAAIELREAGYNVALLECESMPLSSSSINGGYLTLCETEMTPDSRDELFKDLVASAQGDCQEEVVQLYVDTAPEVYTKLIDWGVEFETTEQVAYMTKPWAHIVKGRSGGGLTSVLNTVSDEKGVELLTDTRARRLVRDTNGAVVGVQVEQGDKNLRFGAKNGVILATGGFTQSPELMKSFGKQGCEYIVPITGKGNRGDGLLMALDAGADTAYIGSGVVATCGLGVVNQSRCQIYMSCGAVNVNMNGKRFHDESDNYALIVSAAVDQPQSTFFEVYDSPMRTFLESYEGNPAYALPQEPEYTGDTLSDLANAIAADWPDFDKEAFVQTVNDYSSYVENGFDPEFGREHITGITGDLATIATGPFYAVACGVGTSHTNGGVKTDGRMRVVSAFDGEPISGLYAAGEVTGGFHGFGYMSGAAFGKTVIHGLCAARTLLEDAQV